MSGLGFYYKHSKCEPPRTNQTVTGVIIDTVDLFFALSEAKCSVLREKLEEAMSMKVFTLQYLRKLGGHLNYFGVAIDGYQPFIRELWQGVKSIHGKINANVKSATAESTLKSANPRSR